MYQLTQGAMVIRLEDGAAIPDDPDNRDRIAYERWLADGGVPEPAEEQAPQTRSIDQEAVLFDHENRLRRLERKPTLRIEQFRDGAK